MSTATRDATLAGAMRRQIEDEVADWPPLTPDQQSAIGVIFASGRAMQESGPEAA